MKQLIGSGVLLLGIFGLATACGSRSSEDLLNPSLGGSGGAVGIGVGGSSEIGGDSSVGGSTVTAGGSAAVGGEPSSGGSGFGAGGEISAAGEAGAETIAGTGGATTGGVGGASAGGASSAGAAGTGGVTASGGASGGSAGASIGGTGGSAGASIGGTGGSAGAPAGGASGSAGASGACPAAAPTGMNVACTDQNLTCSYVGERCTCEQPLLRRGALDWVCTGSGNACPATMPIDNTTCRGNLTCPYPDGDQCNCQGGQWNCFTPGCPATKPTAGGNCGAVVGQCAYGNAGACLCIGGAWFCN